MGTKALNRIFSKEFLGIKGFDLREKQLKNPSNLTENCTRVLIPLIWRDFGKIIPAD